MAEMLPAWALRCFLCTVTRHGGPHTHHTTSVPCCSSAHSGTQGMSSALDITAIMLLPLAIVIAMYALAVYFVRWRQMSRGEAEVRVNVKSVCAVGWSYARGPEKNKSSPALSCVDLHPDVLHCYPMLLS